MNQARELRFIANAMLAVAVIMLSAFVLGAVKAVIVPGWFVRIGASVSSVLCLGAAYVSLYARKLCKEDAAEEERRLHHPKAPNQGQSGSAGEDERTAVVTELDTRV